MKNNSKLMSYEQLREIMQMNSLQIIENTKSIKEIRIEFRKSKNEHDKEMKEIRLLFKQMIKRIAV